MDILIAMIKKSKKLLQKTFFFAAFLPSSVFAQYDQNGGATSTVSVASSPAPVVIKGIVRMVEIALSIWVVYILCIVIIAGILFVTSSGDENRMDTAIKWWKRSAIGLVVAPITYLIINAVGEALIRMG